MITRFRIEGFKRLHSAEIELGPVSVLIGPNNSGKTTALQALALWDIGRRRWTEKREGSSRTKRTGVTINRRDLYAIPTPSAKLLWNDLHTHELDRSDGKPKTDKVLITLEAEGLHLDRPWRCTLEFYYANEESFYCRVKDGENGGIPAGVGQHPIVFLPPMSGLAAREHRKERGEISVLIGEGQTAQVLRNLCWQLFDREEDAAWKNLCRHIRHLFHIELQDPVYIPERSELSLTYKEANGIALDISSAGRGCQQVLLLLSFLLANPGAILLLDEPDAHLEILRQRDVYNLLTDIAESSNSQVVAASHSEVVLQEAAERDVVIAFVGKPHRIDTRARGQVKKALESIRMADYYLAEQMGWMLYLEGSTDLAILRRLAERLNHPANTVLHDAVPVIYLGSNKPQEAREHFQGLREAKPDLVGFALFDRLERELHTGSQLLERMWSRREIENYLVTPESLQAFVVQDLNGDDLLDIAEREHRLATLNQCIKELVNALALTGKPDPWGDEIKVTDDFLDPLFKLYYERMNTPQRVFKRDYHGLADAIPLAAIPPEVTQILDAVVDTARNAKPATTD
ncbi:MAG: AAA family ATPase [Dechloromonas sp.]|jgi:energy-coupling factor transporter ATP-binding protein EcfA2|nr:AAA family ATPase [Dechloromonas sp.]